MKKSLLFLSIFVLAFQIGFGQNVKVKNQVFEVLYSQDYEQPLWIRYNSINRPTNVNRGTMDFYTEKGIKTSDGDDYKANIYDKGHGAPAASFSDNIENLKQTFSYLNCILQDQYLNRGEWRLLEEQERRWDDSENLIVLIKLEFGSPIKRIPTNAAIPTVLYKHIYFEKQKKWKCYKFLNVKPTVKWEQSEAVCNGKDHIVD